MHSAVNIVIGLGELGKSFATGLLMQGVPVIPILREHNLAEMAKTYSTPNSVWVCVAEKDLHPLLAAMPFAWQDKLVLIQNELLPHDWQAYPLSNPTIVSVWFEKKSGKTHQIVLPSVVYGPLSTLVLAVYNKLGLPARALANEQDLLFELVLKNLYIQTSNMAGLMVGGTTRELVEQHSSLMKAIAQEVIALQEFLTQTHFDHLALMAALEAAFYGDPNHSCMGRSAPARLQRALMLADQHHLTIPTIRSIPTV
jgi:hypothetical protein